MSKVENLQTSNRAEPFPCVSVALVVLAMFVLSSLAAQGVRNNLQTPLIFAGLCLTNLHRGTAQPSEQVGDHRLRRSASDHIRFRISCPTWPGFDWQHGPVARRFRGEYLHLVRRSSLGVHACETPMSAAQGAKSRIRYPTRTEVCPWRSAPSSALLCSGLTMLATTVNLPTRRASPSPQIRARDTSLDGTTNGSAGINGTTHLGGQRCGDHEDRGDSTNYRKLAKHKIVLPGAIATTMAATNKCLAQSNKSAAGGKVTKKLGGEARPSKASYCQPDKLSTA